MYQAIVFLPLIGFLIAGLLSFVNNSPIVDKAAQFITVSFISVAAFLSAFTFIAHIDDHSIVHIKLFDWIAVGSFIVSWAIYVDPVTRIMLIVISSVSALVHIYSIGYMSHDNSKPRFMAYLSLFTFAMLALVTADNFLQLFFGWEGVGLASYLLIGFWYKKPTANAASIKAFVVNRVGDFGLALGIFSIFYLFGTLDYQEVFSKAESLVAGTSGISNTIDFLGFKIGSLNLICFLLFIGAMGKSAQIFLHTWLPDAMEGPTPVSALIHAATMVTAGVFLIVRCSPMYDLAPDILSLITFIGATTAIFAASIGLVQNDIKRIIAYSTCSQLGYMFFAIGVGAYGAAMFHLFTHAFFKALLFLGAGSVIHAVSDEQDIRKMGGLYNYIPFTHMLMIIGTISLMGFPFTAGYYSKDAIIESAYLASSGFSSYAFIIGLLGVLMTSFYSWRLMFLTFNGTTRIEEKDIVNIHESPKVMLIPLIVLAVGALFSGFFFKDYFIGSSSELFWGNSIALHHHEHQHIPFLIYYAPMMLGFLGLFLAWYMYLKNKSMPSNIVKLNGPLYKFLLNKWYFDELYSFIFVRPAKAIGYFLWKFFDGYIIDGFGPDGIAKSVLSLSKKAKSIQTGYIYHYAFAILIGVSLFITYFIYRNI
ncbi:MAG: NADH-quinone oxidoreductase subunit L [Candidatus Pelagibacterales bacterium]|tara:strand:+ start:6923 stop:8866 length:1944 start_codon:yes stop_codon:yes gene_type:complete